jgi:MoaA/NifB/PqqE/SkfB family radical SAM enzyme/SAM-dependent methyltransferase
LKKALLKVGYTCNNNCVFCHSRPLRRHPDLTTREVERRMLQAQAKGAEMVVLSGGEPTLRGDLPALFRFAREHGLQTGLITNGRRFVYPGFAAELAALGLGFVYLSFHSPSRRGHALSARTDSLPETLGALARLVRLGVPVTVNTVVTSRNISELDAVVDRLASLRPAKIKLSALEPKGAALDDSALCPPLEAAAAAIAAAVRRGRARHPGQSFGCEGLPPCLLPGFAELNDDLVADGFILFREAFEERFFPPDYRNRAKALVCFDCARYDSCPGVYRGYLERAAAPALRPEVRPRSNSFVFANTNASIPIPRGARACPARTAPADTVFLAERGRLWAHRAAPSDFSPAEVAATVRLGQLYATRHGKHMALHHGRDLIKLLPAASCSACALRGGCSRILSPSARNVFAPLEALLEKTVRGLRGDVLEVGCGAVRFFRILAVAARAGRLCYTGIDPELPKKRTPAGMRLVKSDIEGFAAPDASFDHILVLRSHDHIRLPSVAFPKLRRLLRPRGRLTIVDGTAFALLLPSMPANARPGQFQHYRNHDSRQAKSLLEAFGFKVKREIPVDPAGGNEWLLEAERR